MPMYDEFIQESKYESGVQFNLIRTDQGDGSFCWDIDVKTSTSSVRFSMVDEWTAYEFWGSLFDQSRISEVSTDDELPDPDPEGRALDEVGGPPWPEDIPH